MSTKALRFQGKKAIVLGGTSGIGLATCRQLVSEGAHVVAYSRSPEKCQNAMKEMNATDNLPGSFVAYSLDILDRNKLEEAFQANEGFHYLVAAATGGSWAVGNFLEMDMDGFQGSFAKLWGYANAVRYGAHHMNKDGGGAIVLVSGCSARKVMPGYVSLGCAGAALENFVRYLSQELASHKIRINTISPGVIDTPLFDGIGDGKTEFLAKITANNPIPRPGSADEAASGILFALENNFMTGTVIDVDGGASLP